MAANQLKFFLYHINLYTAWEFLQVRAHLDVSFICLFVLLFYFVVVSFSEGGGGGGGAS